MRQATRPATGWRRLAGVVVASLLVATGCGIATPTTNLELSDKPVTLQFAWWGANARVQTTQKVIAAFEARHPNITIEGQFGDWSGYWNRLATTFAADDAPDIVQMDEQYLRSYADRGALFDLGVLSKHLDTSQFSQTALATGTVEGTLRAVPIGVGAMTIVTNLDKFREYGIPVPDDQTWTWADLQRIGDQFDQASGGTVNGMAPIGADQGTLTVWARQHGALMYNDRGEVAIPPELVAEWWTYVRGLAASGATPPPSLQAELLTAPTDQSALVIGRSAMGWFYNTQIGAVQKAMPDAQLALLELPKTPGGVSAGTYYKPSMYWSVASGTEHPAEAAEFIDFMVNDPEAAALLGTERGIPANQKILAGLRPTFSETDAKASAYNDQIADTAGEPAPLTPAGASGNEPIMQRYLTSVLFDQSTPEQAAGDFVDELRVSVETSRS